MPNYVIHYDQGNSSGPFDVYLSGSSGQTLYASNITRVELEAGYVVNVPVGVPSSSIVVINDAFGCSNEVILPIPTVTPTITPSISITATITPTPSIFPSVTPSITPSLTVTPTHTPTPSVTLTITPSITPSFSFGVSPSITPTPTITRTPTVTPPTVCYQYAGGGSNWSDSTTACNNKTCGRDFYRSAPTFNNGDIVYNDCALTSPYNGGGNWVAIATSTGTYCGGGWRAIQINSSGVILSSVACP